MFASFASFACFAGAPWLTRTRARPGARRHREELQRAQEEIQLKRVRRAHACTLMSVPASNNCAFALC
jgi:hypothetical protein